MITSEMIANKTNEQTYPVLLQFSNNIHPENTLVVLMTSKTKGTIVSGHYKSDYGEHVIGEYRNDWITANKKVWSEYKGVIELKNG